MEKFVKKVIKTGYGLGLLSVASAKRLAAQAKKDLHLNEKESERLAQELLSNSRQAGKQVAYVVQQQVEHALLKAKVVDRKEMGMVKKLVKRKLARLRKRR